MTETQTTETEAAELEKLPAMTLDQARGVLAAFGIEPKAGVTLGEYEGDLGLLAGMAFGVVTERLSGLLDIDPTDSEMRRRVLAGFRFIADTHDGSDDCQASGGEHACVQQGLMLLSRTWMRDSLWLMEQHQEHDTNSILKLGALCLALASSMMGYGFMPSGSAMESSMAQKALTLWLQLRAVASQIGLPAINTNGGPVLPFIFVADRWDDEQWKRVGQGHTASQDAEENTAGGSAAEVFAWLAKTMPADELPTARVRIWAARGRQMVEIIGSEPDAVYTIDDYARDEAEREAAAQSADCADADEHAEAAEAGYGHAATIAEGADVG